MHAGCITLGWDPKNETTLSISIPLLSTSEASGTALQHMLQQQQGKPVPLDISDVDLSPLDLSALLLFVLAVGTVVGGSMLSGRDHSRAKLMAHEEVSKHNASSPSCMVLHVL